MKTQCSRTILTNLKFETTPKNNSLPAREWLKSSCVEILSDQLSLCNIRVLVIYWHRRLVMLVNLYGKPFSLTIWAFFFLFKSCILIKPSFCWINFEVKWINQLHKNNTNTALKGTWLNAHNTTTSKKYFPNLLSVERNSKLTHNSEHWCLITDDALPS